MSLFTLLFIIAYYFVFNKTIYDFITDSRLNYWC
jgi:hypothetical protein